ncbi:hypothetical protein CIG75_00870 [Tumebacillus algifaecis]|uniref:ribose-phosphate diphosphokinase n=1 Tax=Tumebacillus algifaecis TaxID=1214604 RepID=A0A223CWS1_9BACL|nr:ribose-phosphate diphosphokinase [Tumebacillus algifaecis]ASS73667.1 hypothetical protein CIG75_00870 [Tumebacillus algifaecis]
MDNAILLVGPGSEHLGDGLHEVTGIPLGQVSRRIFPDQEVCVRVDASLQGKVVFILQNTQQPQERHLQQLYQLVEVAANQGAEQIICIVPYLAYSRQDRRTHEGEPESGLIVLRTLQMLGADKIVTVDVHNPRLLERASLPAVNLTTETLFADFFMNQDLVDPVIVSPDRGGSARVGSVASITRFPTLVLKKNKDVTGYTWYDISDLHLKGRDVVVLDDLCSSGSTFIPLAQYLREVGAGNIYYGVTHFFANGDQVMERIGFPVRILGSDTILTPWMQVSVVPLIARWIERELTEICASKNLNMR